ncbi:MAG: FkbM family methyltransferase [Chthoniobacterales bacterium]
MPPLRATWGEIFEPAIADLYDFRDTVPDLIIDIGANMGSFTCWAAYLRPKAVVHAFEPSEKHADWLEKNAVLNGLSNVGVHRKAVTNDGREVLYSHFDAGGSSGIFLHGEGRVEKITSTSLDCIDFAKSASVFFKIDCEGAEGEIIE